MATVKRLGLPDFWVTGLAKILVGDQPCRFQAWINGHFKIQKRPQDTARLAQYKLDHTAQLTQAVERFTADGWTCRVEQWMKLVGRTATITGKADVIRLKHGDVVVSDIKSGARRDADLVQVQIYQIMLPLIWRRPTLAVTAEVIYPDGGVITPIGIETIKPRLFALVRELASDTPPDPSPSESNCRFCDVSETDCPQRWREGTTIADTTEF